MYSQHNLLRILDSDISTKKAYYRLGIEHDMTKESILNISEIGLIQNTPSKPHLLAKRSLAD